MDLGTFTWIASPDGALETDIPAWREATGQPVEALLGDGWLDSLHPEDRPGITAAWRRAVRERTPYSVTYRLGAQDEWRHLSIHGIPVVDDDGTVLRFVGMGQDVTDRELDRDLLQAVVAHTPAALAVTWGPAFVFRVVNDAYRELLPAGREPLGQTVAEVLAEADALPYFEEVRATGHPLRFEEFAVAWGGERSFEGNRYYDYTLQPLPGHDGVGGVLVVAVETTDKVRRRRTLERRLDEERRVAEALQRAMLPPAPELPGVEVVVRYLPAGPEVQVGGDWYDGFELPGGRVAIVVGDVAGRGVEAARLMSQLRAAVRAYALQGHGPASVLRSLEAFLAAQEPAQMATLLYAELSADRRRLDWASAGHLPAVLAGGDGAAALLEGGLGPPIGAPRGPIDVGAAAIAPGDMLLLYTDGLVEDRRRPLETGMQRLLDATARSASAGPGAVCDAALADVLADPERHDDVALLAVRITRSTGTQAAGTWKVPAIAPAVSELRGTVAAFAAANGVGDPPLPEIRLALSEAMSNAVLHAFRDREEPGTVEVELVVDHAAGAVRIRVADDGDGVAPRGDSPGIGLGMPLIGNLAESFEIRPRAGAGGTEVTMTFRLTPPAATAA